MILFLALLCAAFVAVPLIYGFIADEFGNDDE